MPLYRSAKFGQNVQRDWTEKDNANLRKSVWQSVEWFSSSFITWKWRLTTSIQFGSFPIGTKFEFSVRLSMINGIHWLCVRVFMFRCSLCSVRMNFYSGWIINTHCSDNALSRKTYSLDQINPVVSSKRKLTICYAKRYNNANYFSMFVHDISSACSQWERDRERKREILLFSISMSISSQLLTNANSMGKLDLHPKKMKWNQIKWNVYCT